MFRFIASLSDPLSRLSRDTRGVTLVEYAIALTVAVTLGAAAFTVLQTGITGSMAAAGTGMP